MKKKLKMYQVLGRNDPLWEVQKYVNNIFIF